MNKGMSSQEARKFLPAFADGELDVEQNLRVLEQMAMDPTNTKRVLHQQQLRQACARVMCGPEKCCPDALRATLEALAKDEAGNENSPPAGVRGENPGETFGGTPGGGPGGGPGALRSGAGGGGASENRAEREPVIGFIGRWLAPLAVAAVLFIGALVALNFYNPNQGAVGPDHYTADGLITANLASTFAQRHDQCSLDTSALMHSELFPAEVADLDDALAEHVGIAMKDASLDLSSLGYDYQIAGLCPVPGNEAVHVIYQNPEGRSLSLWIKPYDAQPTLDPGVPYSPPSDHTDHPMVVWRQDNTVFFLVGDRAEDVQQARPAIRLASAI